MTQYSYPFGTSSIATEDQWSAMFRMPQVDGVFATSETGTDLKVTGSNVSTVAVGLGEAWIQGTYYKHDDVMNLAVPSNSGGGSARNDLVVLRRDPVADSITIQYKTGGSAFPSLTQTTGGTWEIPLAKVTVAAGSSVVAPAGVTDTRYFLGRPVVLAGTADTRPAVRGQLKVVSGTDIYMGDGSNWNFVGSAEAPAAKTYTPVWSTQDGSTINWGTGAKNVGRFKRLSGNLYWVKIELIPTNNPNAMNDSPVGVTLPFPVQGSCRELFQVNFSQLSTNGGKSFVGTAMVFPTEGANRISRIRIPTSDGTNSAGAVVNSRNFLTNSPFNVQSGDILTISGTYEIA
jgi:hypothetical protein